VLNFVFTREEVDPARAVVMEWSFGGLLASRAVAGEFHIAALIADFDPRDQLDAIRLLLPPNLANRLPKVPAQELEPHLQPLLNNLFSHWKFAQRGLWVHGVWNLGQYVLELARYRLWGAVSRIYCPT
jgi:hypothetical protein